MPRALHNEILTVAQTKLLPLVKTFNTKFSLVGGTAVALHIGHRRSIDFDLFSHQEFRNNDIKKRVTAYVPKTTTLVIRFDEFTCMCAGVKMTFYRFPNDLKYTVSFGTIIKIPDLLTLAAMKAYALCQRAKWKDYVDLYFIMQRFHSYQEVVACARKYFGGEFNEKLFRIQLGYFDDVNYEEDVEYMPGFAVPDNDVKTALREISLS